MTFRTRILLACLAVAVIPLALFAFGARNEVQRRLRTQFGERVTVSTAMIQTDLANRSLTLDRRLSALARRIDADPQLRLALVQRLDRGSLLDYAADAMSTAELDYLLLLDEDGTVLSSGHFRNEFDRQMDAFPALLAAKGPALIATRRAEGPMLALVRVYEFFVNGRRFVLAGGIEIDSTFVRTLARDTTGTLVVSLDYPGGSLRSHADADRIRFRETTGQIAVPFIDDAGDVASVGDNARWTVAHSSAPLDAVRTALDRWLLAAAVGAVMLALLSARVLAARVNRPLEELAEKSAHVHLDRIDVQLATERPDEIGTLSRTLDAMVLRLRASARELRTAERRATVGDLARQVNHDVRNGLLPIRNVIRHLAEVARESPTELGSVFAEREGTLHGGITYLESLATNYARLSPRTERQPCDLNETVRAVLEHSAADGDARVQIELSSTAPRVTADPVALRRVIENLVVNALESLPPAQGTVTVRTSVEGDQSDRLVTLTVTDTGSGIAAAVLERIFDDFYTTKERGTGLGLSIVRRLVGDMGGRIHVHSETGRGTTFRIELPEAS